MSEAVHKETDVITDPDIDIDENEVNQIIESINEAEYFDSSSMAALTPTSVVSIRGISYKNHSEKVPGSYSPFESI